jgi:hypothetical protein
VGPEIHPIDLLHGIAMMWITKARFLDETIAGLTEVSLPPPCFRGWWWW